MSDVLTDTDIAREFLARGSGIFTADSLAKWMNQRGIGHRDAVTVAEAVNRLQAAQIATVEETAFQTSLQQGTTAPSEAAYAAMINQMPLDRWHQYRAQLGLA